MLAWVFAFIFFGIGAIDQALADNSGASPAPNPIESPPAPVQSAQLPWNFDPCGGPQELLDKYGTTPCVVVGGEAVFAASYVSAKINGTFSVSSSVLPQVAATTSALLRSYPSAQAIIGVGPFTQVDIIPPTYARVDTTAFPLLVSGSTDWKVSVKQRIEFNPTNGTITAVSAGVELPTGSPALRAPAPAYSFDLIGEKAWPNRLALVYDMHLFYAGLKSGGRVWTLSPTVLGAWSSPGNLLAGAGVVILPSGKAIPMIVAAQLFSRHIGIEVLYAGLGASGFTTSTQPGLPIVSDVSVNGNVNALTVTLVGLIGKSGP